jgi:hypothetical protein
MLMGSVVDSEFSLYDVLSGFLDEERAFHGLAFLRMDMHTYLCLSIFTLFSSQIVSVRSKCYSSASCLF